jgi:5'-nucleotidase
VLLHEGGFQSVPFSTNPDSYRGCTGFTGPVVDIVKNTTKDVDLFLTGHTHQPYNCIIDGRPVTSASSFGRLVTDVDLTLGRNGDVKSVAADNIPIYAAGKPPVAEVQARIDRYDKLSAPLRAKPVGRIKGNITRDAAPAGENATGDLIADAQLADTDDAGRGGAVGALMNPGGVRADFPAVSGPDVVRTLTCEEAFTIQPFNNIVATQTFTGAQLLDVLKDQWCGSNSAPTVLLPSSTITYATLSEFDIDSLVRYLEPSLTGAPIEGPAPVRITANP